MALKKYLGFFDSKGLKRTKGKNVVIVYKEILAVSCRLHSYSELTNNHTMDVLKGFFLCSDKSFCELFQA